MTASRRVLRLINPLTTAKQIAARWKNRWTPGGVLSIFFSMALALSAFAAQALPVIIPIPTVQITSLAHSYAGTEIIDGACGSAGGTCSGPGFTAAIANGDEILMRFQAPSGMRFHVFYDAAITTELLGITPQWSASPDAPTVTTPALINFENLTGTAPTEASGLEKNFFGVGNAGAEVAGQWFGIVTGDFAFTAVTLSFTVNNSPPGATALFGSLTPSNAFVQPGLSFFAFGLNSDTVPDQILMQLEPNGPDKDGDGIADNFDNCPDTPNGPFLGTCLGTFPQGQATCHANSDCVSGKCSLSQEDTGGIGAGSPPDGIGDACQCGDVNNDGVVNSSDKTILSRSLAGLGPYGSVTAMPGFNKCDVNGDGLCNVADKTIIARAIAGLGPGIKQTCHAATTFP